MQSPRVLFIDDDAYLTAYVVEFLQRQGFQVSVANDASAGFAMICGAPASDLIVTDLRLPDVSGVDLLARLFALPLQVPVIVLTGYPDELTRAEALRLGAVAYLQKPLVGPMLCAELRRALTQGGLSSSGPQGGCTLAHLICRLLAPEIDIPEYMQLANALRAAHVRQTCYRCADARRLVKPSGSLALLCKSMTPIVAQVADKLRRAGGLVMQIHEAAMTEHFRISPSHLGRLLKEQTGLSFREWQWGVALKPATLSLARSTLSIKEIAYECGFGSSEHFDRCFSRIFGMTPTDFRTLSRELSQCLQHYTGVAFDLDCQLHNRDTSGKVII